MSKQGLMVFLILIGIANLSSFATPAKSILELKTNAGDLKSEEIKAEIQSEEIESSFNPYLRHAPLALFGASSLAVGGIIFAIKSEPVQGQNRQLGRSGDWNFALGLATVTALISGSAYAWYVRKDLEPVTSQSSLLIPQFAFSSQGWAAEWRLSLQLL